MITISTVQVVEVLDSTFEIGITILNDDTRTWGKIISMRPNFDDVNDDIVIVMMMATVTSEVG